ncbi:MAG: hypothetical protein ACOYJL_03265 [Tractidigestivibacter sp.]|jgi:hypothetical protein|uniref:hypothetical protein n=1 Tax=Tractidigestivibacter sp. TaxID=2847320 RepID=UPI003D8BE725
MASIHLEHQKSDCCKLDGSTDFVLAQSIVERYKGVIVAGEADGTATLDISIPIPEK